jgi:hypothetical protein
MAGGYGEEVVGNIVKFWGWDDDSRGMGATNFVLWGRDESARELAEHQEIQKLSVFGSAND